MTMLAICAVFAICILLTGTIAPALLIQEVDAKKSKAVSYNIKKNQ